MAHTMTKDSGDGPPANKAKVTAAVKKPKAPVRVYERQRGGEARMISDLVPEIGRAAFLRW